MRMNEKVSSTVSYVWNGFIGVLGSVSTDAYMILIALRGMLLTAFIKNHWQKKRFNAEFGNGND